MENKHRSQAACKSISPWSCWWSAGTERGIVRGSSGCALHRQTVSLPSFFIIIKKFWSILINIQYWSFSIIIEIFFINTDLRWHHLWTTRSLGLIQSHGRCEEPHTELRWWQSLFSFSYEIFIMIFMTIFPLRDHPPHVFLGEERICFIWGMYSFPAAVSWFADCPDWNHIWPGFTPLIILCMKMIKMIKW